MTSTTPLTPPTIAAPNLPTAPPSYTSVWMNQFANVLRLFFNQITTLVNLLRPSGTYSNTFKSGYIQYIGPNATPLGNINLEFGTNLPNPSGTPGAALLLGSGGGNGTPASFWIITDEAYDSKTPGNFLGITAGETQPAGVAAGGELFIIAGASYGGTGGLLQLQGGTSLNGPAGETVLQGGNSTNGIAGDVFITGGQNGTAGANVHLIMTTLNGISGNVRIRNNSTILYQFESAGQIFIGSSGAGLAGQPLVSGGPSGSTSWQTGYTGTITTAKLTGGGTNGSMTFSSGILISQVAAT